MCRNIFAVQHTLTASITGMILSTCMHTKISKCCLSLNQKRDVLQVFWILTTFGSTSKPHVNNYNCLEYFVWRALHSFVEIVSCLQFMHCREERASSRPCQDFLRAVQPDGQGAGDQRGGEGGRLPGARLHECPSAATQEPAPPRPCQVFCKNPHCPQLFFSFSG